ncbi:hypothetical protein [Cognatiyoonia sp. IB215182]|uniref:hypothetical protein n=1 Tax=Cognatiyoonia sp. IB215182 TaxID=3097353 RepID=UPI002A111D95|nr:hypothetical protein [Cognatiyoonia sp. IB215182]MDX8354457.1 hypothetical protein [Cognatiyoonia sp. IB215182]
MIRLYCAALALLPFHAFAQPAPAMDDVACAASYASASAFSIMPIALQEGPVAIDGWCEVTGLQVQVENSTEIRIEELRWRSAGHARLDEGLPPTALQMQITDLQYLDLIGDPLLEYLMRVQSVNRQVDITFDAYWDAAERRVSLIEARLGFAYGNMVALSGTFEDVDLSDEVALAQSLGSGKVTEVNATIQTYGLFEEYVVPAIIFGLLDGAQDPAAAVERLKQEGMAIIDSVPERILDAQSAANLAALIRDMPHPQGRISMAARSESGIGPLNLFGFAVLSGPNMMSDLWDSLPDLEVALNYEKGPL